MPSCAVNTCNRKSATSSLTKDGTTFHKFPRGTDIRKLWIKACNKNPSWTPKESSTVCSRHFLPHQFQCLHNKRRKLIDFAFPTLFLSKSTGTETDVDHIAPTTCLIENQHITNSTSTAAETTSLSTVLEKIEDVKIVASGLIDKGEVAETPEVRDMTPRKNKLLKRLQLKNKKIKRLQSKIRYLSNKVTCLQEILKNLHEKSSISKDEQQVKY